VPLSANVSKRDPASIQTPTVAVFNLGLVSVATLKPLSNLVIRVSGKPNKDFGYV